MKNIDQMIVDLKDIVVSDKHTPVYEQLVRTLGKVTADFIHMMSYGADIPILEDKMGYGFYYSEKTKKESEESLEAYKALAVLQWLKSDVIPIITE